MPHRRRWSLILAAALLCGCSKTVWTPQVTTPAAPPAYPSLQSSLKVHLLSGDLVVLAPAGIAQTATALTGTGVLFDPNRRRVRGGLFVIPLDSVALLETETRSSIHPAGLAVMVTWTAIMSVITVACVSDPKSCFGSCPTFYADGDSVPQAEGFSASIARVLEARDVDALFRVRASADSFALTMRNEALETHAVRHVRILAVPRPAGGRVLAAGDGRFYPATVIAAPDRCTAAEGDCLAEVRAFDALERRSLTDSADLAARETVELAFPAPAGTGPLGLVVGARHTYVSTYLFYRTLAWMGRRAGEYTAALERGDAGMAAAVRGANALLGGIDVAVRGGDGWREAGRFDEMGPIATDVQVVPIGAAPAGGGPVRVRLTLAQGSWRTNWVALARLGDPVSPDTLDPAGVTRAGRPDTAALAALLDPDRYLVTYPGDAYRITFAPPPSGANSELFLDTQGYYYEWMRGEWLREEDPARLAEVLFEPAVALRRLAPSFKLVEPVMERLFWASRFGR